LFDSQRVGGGGGGRFLQKRMQPTQQRFNLLRIKHGRGDQKRRRAGRHQRWIAFEILFQRVVADECGPLIPGQILLRRWIWSKTQFQQRLLARLLVGLGFHSHL